jgi:AraC-like DNA-binding protein
MFSIAMVLAGTFQYRGSNQASGAGEVMTPGSILLGNPGQNFECGHQHAMGDRCLSFHYSHEVFERVAGDADLHGRKALFPVLKLPPLRGLASLFYRASALVQKSSTSSGVIQLLLEEFSLEMAARSLQISNGNLTGNHKAQPSMVSRVTGVLRMIEDNPGSTLKLTDLARQSGLSPYHFLRIFKHVTGLAPHQYVRRLRLAEAAARLLDGNEKALDVAVDSGFNDASNFSRVFRAELGMTPRDFRKQCLLPAL